MSILKQQIEELYLKSKHFDVSSERFVANILDLIGEDDAKQTRSKLQSRSRWRYLTLVANKLNELGYEYEAPGLPMPLKWTKDMLYHIYWTTVKETLFPKKKRQLNTAEFCQVVDHVMDLFSMAFDVQIAFPNMRDFLNELEAKNNTNSKQ